MILARLARRNRVGVALQVALCQPCANPPVSGVPIQFLPLRLDLALEDDPCIAQMTQRRVGVAARGRDVRVADSASYPWRADE